MADEDDVAMVDFVINLPFERAHGWFQANSPGGEGAFLDELRGREVKPEDINARVAPPSRLGPHWWAHRYIRLSDNRTEVQIWFSTDGFTRYIIDKYLVHIGERFPEAQLDLYKAVRNEEMAGWLPSLKAMCDEWRPKGYVTGLAAKNRALSELEQTLTALLRDRFSRDELKDLCQSLGVDYEDFPDSKSILARDLVRYCGRHGRLSALVAMGRQSRPDIEWPRGT